jgi:sulfoquinovosyltransferase
MTISEVREEDEENPPSFLDYDTISRPRRIALFIEPSPFA